MNIISEISRHEMTRRWAIGEVNSQFFCFKDQTMREETLAWLKSGDPIKEENGIKRHHVCRGHFINSIPLDTRWFLASLPIVEDEFNKLRTIKDNNGWNKYSSGSYLFCDAANYLIKNLDVDQRIKSIINRPRDRNIESTGITLISKNKKGPYIIAEGTARLVAIYYHCILKGIKLFENNTIEVVVGVSKTKWCWSPV
ncbi:MAG: hypothetical protein WBA71_02545 [Candidatus Humimicrobiia bacterium]